MAAGRAWHFGWLVGTPGTCDRPEQHIDVTNQCDQRPSATIHHPCTNLARLSMLRAALGQRGGRIDLPHAPSKQNGQDSNADLDNV